jgi:cyclophilin family peptidyl-prolyl cis-trans isomerase/HEAT repeat protein
MPLRLCLAVVLLLGPPSVAAQPAPERPSDDLLARPALQEVVEAQVARNGEKLTRMLDADDPAVRARAAFALASVQDTTAIPALLKRLQDGVPIVRTDAVFALAQMPGGVPPDRLLKTLRFERDPAMQRGLIRALGTTGDAASLRALLDLGLPPARFADVALALARYGMRGVTDSTAGAWLANHLTVDDAWTRRNAAYALGRVPTLVEGRIDSVRRALDAVAPDDPAAMHLLRALGAVGDSSDAERAANWLRSAPDWRTRVDAARALAGLPDAPAARSALVRALNDDHPLVARRAAETLAGADWSADTRTGVGIWIDAHPDRWRAIAPLLRGLARNGRPGRALRTVEQWRTARSPVAYAEALPSLAPLDTARADTLLTDALSSKDPRVAAAAVQALGARWERVRPERPAFFFQHLSGTVRRGDPALLYHGAPLLTDSLFVARGAADTLAATYRTLSTPADLEGMTAVLDALATIGGPTATATLRTALDHPHHAIRKAAAAGLTAATDTTVTAAPKPLPDTPSLDWDYLQTLGPAPRLVLDTNPGTVTIELDTEQAPQTVQAITRFARNGRYDGVPFHRVVPNFVVQGGDFARGDGFGGPGVFLRTEITRLGHRRGTLGMASAGKDTEGSQFFVPHSMQPHLDGGYTSFGRVVEGMDTIDRLRVNDRITDATVRPSEL